jgi:hypothetical protein
LGKSYIRSTAREPNIRALALSEILTTILQLNPESNERKNGKDGQNTRKSSYPPIWDSPPFGWFCLVSAAIIGSLGFWGTFIFSR